MRTLLTAVAAAACGFVFVSAAALAGEPGPGAKASDGTVFAGMLGGVRLSTLPADPKPLSWTSARDYCTGLDALGHHDWSLPNDAELELLYKNRKAIGGFMPTDYASGEIAANVDTRDFSSGGTGEARSWDVLAFRCVRHG